MASALFATWFAWGGSAFLCAQNLTLRQMDHTAWTARDGAPIGVNSIAAAQDGTLWLATRGGLYRFDGLHFTAYIPPAGEPSLPSIEMRSVYMAPDGALWVAPWLKGLVRIKDGHVRVFDQNDGLSSDTVAQVLQAPDRAMWALSGGVLYKQKGDLWQEALPQSQQIGEVVHFFFDRAGTLWIATRNLIYFVAKGTSVPQKTSEKGGSVSDFIEMADGSLWINALPPAAVIRRLSVPGHPSPFPLSYPVEASGITLDPKGNLWVASNRNGVQRVASDVIQLHDRGSIRPNNPGVQKFDTEAGLSGLGVFTVFHDANGTIWAGTTRGLDRFRMPTLTKLPDTSIEGDVGITACPNGTVWMGSGDFLISVTGEAITHYKKGELWGLYCDRNNTVWFNRGGAIVQLRDGKEQSIPVPDPNLPYCVVQLAGDAENLYADCALSGLWRRSNNRWTRIEAPGFPKESPIAIMQDASGRVWAGFTGNRVGLVDGASTKTYAVDSLPGLGNVQAILVTKDAVFAGGVHGLAALRDDRFQSLLTADSDTVQGVSGLVEAHNGDIWLNGARGVFRIPAGELTRALHSGSYRMQSERFSGDGLVGFAYQGYELPSAVIAPNGRIWIATSSTAVYVDPEKITADTVPAITSIQGFTDNESPRYEAFPKIDPGTHTLRIRYFGAHLNAPERVTYRYRLDGQDPGWQEVGPRTEAVYTNLRPGAYTFHVAASNGENIWSEAPSPLKFEVLPAFYQRWWFLSLCIVALLLLIGIAFRMRFEYATTQMKRRLEERAQERMRIARDLHDTLLQGIQGLILCFHSDIEEVPEDLPARGMLEKTLDRAEDVIAEGRERVRSLRSEESTADDLPTALAQASALVPSKGAASIEFLVEGEPRSLRTIVYDEIYSIGREAISNALRHANATRIEVEISYGAMHLRLRCRDNGTGMTKQQLEAGSPAGHWGITGMKERASRVGAKLDIWSTAGAGTEVEVNVPAATAYFVNTPRKPWTIGLGPRQ
ncbi:signal transduction histidine kinase/ligand-binding sensor domain-containing protein [Granulicella aggregans]|uniref:Signal transduction histidine kinase/ligand-binding sensor domain-containing protein n=1 Tax=Granulicella aggregans TaxID=474949 RepID=A0A7W7ZGB8_9BACT|nr:triple tyrosine motif-containing protein [Granulicella aggregans]MBB5059317.1 signal transduction histidine kinase/ligand-binding sensor domain-containing protein [Granulicella aggregans]